MRCVAREWALGTRRTSCQSTAIAQFSGLTLSWRFCDRIRCLPSERPCWNHLPDPSVDDRAQLSRLFLLLLLLYHATFEIFLPNSLFDVGMKRYLMVQNIFVFTSNTLCQASTAFHILTWGLILLDKTRISVLSERQYGRCRIDLCCLKADSKSCSFKVSRCHDHCFGWTARHT